MTSLKLAAMVWSGKRHLVIYGLHEKYGKIVRTGQYFRLEKPNVVLIRRNL